MVSFPKNDLFPFSGKEAINSFDFFDIIGGTGVQNFYGSSLVQVSGSNLVTNYVLTNKLLYSDNIATKATLNYTAMQPILNLPFDLNFKVPRTISGMVIINIPHGINSLGNINTGKKLFSIIELYRVDVSGTENFLISGQTLTYNPNGTSNDVAYSKILSMGLPVGQLFVKDEKFRIRVRTFATAAIATNIQAGIAHDPQDRIDNNDGLKAVVSTSGPIITSTTTAADGQWATDTVFLVQIPFKLEVDI